MPAAIQVEHVSKHYSLGRGAGTLRDALAGAWRAGWTRIRGRQAEASPCEAREIWPLKDINLDIEAGEIIGVVGRNGAGKSTLLKILSRITPPTTGRVRIAGRMASLLEVGTGFHPELTGRENVILNGTILGMTRPEICRRFDAIVDYAGIGLMLDVPVKRYSSGMYMRLAFSVAAHLDSEILVIDEVLAVGDAAFQKKCLASLQSAAHSGRTVLLVSHNMTAVTSLCRRAIWLHDGRLEQDGPSAEVIGRYLQSLRIRRHGPATVGPEAAPGNERVRLRHVQIMAAAKSEGQAITVGDVVEIEFGYWALEALSSMSIAAMVDTQEGICVFCSVSPPAQVAKGFYQVRIRLPEGVLNEGSYSLRLRFKGPRFEPVCNFDHIAAFDIHDLHRDLGWYGKWPGLVRLNCDWQIVKTHLPAQEG